VGVRSLDKCHWKQDRVLKESERDQTRDGFEEQEQNGD
jgi:hypothetical protein